MESPWNGEAAVFELVVVYNDEQRSEFELAPYH
jgi:hypothetical protein